jgi:hypothetical protein
MKERKQTMKTTLAIALALGLGAASIGWAFDQDALNSRKALTTYGKMEMKEKQIVKKEAVKETAIASEEKAAPEKKATVAVTRDSGISADDRDLGAAEAVSAHSSKGNTFK